MFCGEEETDRSTFNNTTGKNTYIERAGYKSKKTDDVMSYFHLILSSHFSVGIHTVNFTDVIS